MSFNRLIQTLTLIGSLTLVSVTAHAVTPIETCDKIHFGDNEGDSIARAEETLSVPYSGTALKVTAAHNGGVSIYGTQATAFKVHVCKTARAATQEAANQLLSQVKVENGGNSIQPVGPEGGKWVASLIIEAPANASLDVSAYNGPVSFHDMSGALKAEAKNGPVAFKGVSGDVNAQVQNGPVSFSGNSGNIKINAKNGPIMVKLEGGSWSGSGLQAETTNGPVSVTLPPDYQSGVEIVSNGYSPINCKARGCDNAQRVQEGRTRKITFGNGEPIVRLSTTNGPVSVNNLTADY